MQVAADPVPTFVLDPFMDLESLQLNPIFFDFILERSHANPKEFCSLFTMMSDFHKGSADDFPFNVFERVPREITILLPGLTLVRISSGR